MLDVSTYRSTKSTLGLSASRAAASFLLILSACSRLSTSAGASILSACHMFTLPPLLRKLPTHGRHRRPQTMLVVYEDVAFLAVQPQQSHDSFR